MKLSENYNSAIGKYGESLVKEMLSAGIPNKYLLSACRFHCSPPYKSISILKVQFRQWMTYVVPFIQGIDVNNLTYEQFDKTIQNEMQKHICPNPIYDDGNITIGVFKSKKDAALCPLKPLNDKNYDFCVCSELGYNKYTKQGYKILVIFDKSKALDDNTKYVFAIVKNGIIVLWNANNYPIYGSTEYLNENDVWRYIDSLPDKAQEALMSFAEQTKITESTEFQEMITTEKGSLTRAKLKNIIREAIRDGLMEAKGNYGPNGYRIIKDGMDFKFKGNKMHSAVSVANEDDSLIYHVVEDDHGYTLYVTDEGETEHYQYPYLFSEFYEAFKTLPPLS